ncbi:MAG: hypothetical protein JG777_1001 [Clostridia bacterium]|jgi:hypothetical protein|uniref:hypothetical protein n=1 Tax=Petroclostridium xylanilyticum TaxID=1792311 RepID=UPI001FA90EFB|nr:hypothetical protein [Petroclostridium xylanilyticum]MBZ4645512.1 hypothetical protein [Clostridia bacterium]
MDENQSLINIGDSEELSVKDIDDNAVTYNTEKDFYVGAQGELRLKAEGLFKKAREKGISIEDIQVMTLKENRAEFPGIGMVELSTFIAKVKGRLLKTGQTITDGKQIDYYNRYQKYIAKKIEQKNIMRDENGKIIWEEGRPKIKPNPDLFLTEWERFEIGKALVEDKEFGLEKTITGACDRVIRKLMGENDWLYPGEAALLDEEFEEVQERIKSNKEEKQAKEGAAPIRKASERQINFFKSKIRNAGLDAENDQVISAIMEEMGYKDKDIQDLSVGQMSKAIDSIYQIIPNVKEKLSKRLQ